MVAFTRIQQAAEARIRLSADSIAHTLGLIRAGKAMEAEGNAERRVANIVNLLRVSLSTARAVVQGREPAALGLVGTQRRMAEAIQGDGIDWVPIAWLDMARRASNAVGRVLVNGRGLGTGFLVSDRLMITNNHVIPSPAEARFCEIEFNYELDADGDPREAARWALDPETFFITDETDDLDFTLVALGPRRSGRVALADLTCCPLSDDTSKHAIGNHVTVVQHPNGDYKLIVFRENRLVHRGDNVLHYIADTQPGASGSPVFNDRFQPVALHHWGGPFREVAGPDGQPLNQEINEGIRISSIVRELKQRRDALAAAQQDLLDAALRDPADLPRPETDSTAPSPLVVLETETEPEAEPEAEPGPEPQPPPAPLPPAPVVVVGVRAIRPDPDYDNRRGYNVRFLGRAHPVPLPVLARAQRRVAARPCGVGDGPASLVLDYHHFSIAMNAARRLAFFTAVNIDGYSWRNVDRDSGLARESAAAEARERWWQDPRIGPAAQTDDPLYSGQNTRRRFFHRGHLVRRLDPTWGAKDMAERANADTFHFTNCAPQSSGFNDSKSHWAGIEDFVLFTADSLRERISVFSGPVLADDDPTWRGLQVPRAYFKIVARIDEDRLVATALLAEQDEFVATILAGGERFDDWDALPARLAEFQIRIGEVERLTGLDFGQLRDHDSFGAVAPGAEAVARRRLETFADLQLEAPG